MSTTGGRNRKRSDVNRTATRRSTKSASPEADVLESDEAVPAEAKASGSTAVGDTTGSTEEVEQEENVAVDEPATDAAVAADTGRRKGRKGRLAKDAEAGEKPEKPLSERAQRREAKKAMRMGNPAWFIPVMLGLFILGLIWIVVFYLSQMAYPIPDIQYWNLVIGFGLLMLGFAMTTRWK